MSPIERAARALCKARGYNPDELCANYGPDMVPVWHVRAEDVRLMLQAIREPSPEMLRAGNVTIPAQDECTPCFEYDLGEHDANRVWQAMIDAALTE